MKLKKKAAKIKTKSEHTESDAFLRKLSRPIFWFSREDLDNSAMVIRESRAGKRYVAKVAAGQRLEDYLAVRLEGVPY